MSQARLARIASVVSIAALAGLLAAPASATSFSKVVSFGDSLTDTGNFLEVSTILNGIAPGLFPAVLPQPADYFQGRFSNGRVAVEVLADALLGTVGDGQALTLENYAYGGSTTGTAGLLANTGLQSQLATFSSRLQPGFGADANALYFVWAGGNDLRAAAAAPATAPAVIGQAIGNLQTTITTLYGLGARNFLLPNLPDLGLSPEARLAGPVAEFGGTLLSESFNAALGQLYGSLSAYLPGAHLVTFDAMAVQRDVTNNPDDYGMTNVENPCFAGGVGVPGPKCATPGSFLYWDTVHPTTAAHEILGRQMAAAVPEPGTWLMMALGGLALLGWQRRRAG